MGRRVIDKATGREKGGSAYMKEKGEKSVMLRVTPDEHTAIVRAAAMQDPPQSIQSWAHRLIVEAAQKVLVKHDLAG
jgi:uncharacterized protein (DUF1778 family)